MATIKIDFSQKVKAIKPMHSVGQPPFAGGFREFNFSPMRYLKNANIPYSRLHDVGGVFGGNRFVDICNIFRDFNADVNDPTSYEFEFTDVLIAAMIENNVNPLFRLGETIENQMTVKAIRIHPPKDFLKWAQICEHIIRHYNEGWADGYTYGIEYWEIWGEPDNGPTPETNQLWSGTPEQYYELYDVTAKHLKDCFGDSIKIGGYGACEFTAVFYDPQKYGINYPQKAIDGRYEKETFRLEFFLNFVKHIKESQAPIDFFSWHSYTDVEKTFVMNEFVRRILTENGYSEVEILIDEWNNAHSVKDHGTSRASAAAASMMLAMQDSSVDMLCYYDARFTATIYGGFFAPLTCEPLCTYYSFVAFGRLYALGTQVKTEVLCDESGLYAIAATNGRKNALMIVNCTEKVQELSLEGVDMSDARIYMIDQRHLLSMAFDADRIANNTVLLIEW